jgi:hypothetical protein
MTVRFLKLKADQIVSLLAEVDQKVPLAVLTKKYTVSSTSIWKWGDTEDWMRSGLFLRGAEDAANKPGVTSKGFE